MANAAVANAAAAGAEVATAAEPADRSFSRGSSSAGWLASVRPAPRTPAQCQSLPDPSQMLPETPPPVTQDFRYLIYYVWSELPPAEKPADIVLRSLKDTPVGTPVEEKLKSRPKASEARLIS